MDNPLVTPGTKYLGEQKEYRYEATTNKPIYKQMLDVPSDAAGANFYPSLAIAGGYLFWRTIKAIRWWLFWGGSSRLSVATDSISVREAH